jgi:hypothetical protein
MLKRLFQMADRFVNNPEIRFNYLTKLRLHDWLSDEEFIRKKFRVSMGREINFNNPKTFNEKLQWIKLHDRKSIYTTMVDKYASKKLVANQIGSEHIIPLLGVWEHFDDIDFDKLPQQFVLKCTHDSGCVIIVKDKELFDIKLAKKKLERSLRRNYYMMAREWPYKNVPRRIIAEKYVVDSEKNELRDYKFFCFNGKVKCFKIDWDRFKNHKANYYDCDCKPLYFREKAYPFDYECGIDMPRHLKDMISFAEIFSKDIPFVRVDFYEVNGQVYFGEFTFFPTGGFGPFIPEEWDEKLGDWLTLPEHAGGGAGADYLSKYNLSYSDYYNTKFCRRAFKV